MFGEKYPKSTLADLYDPLTMPSYLLKAHQALDKSVDATYYGKRDSIRKANAWHFYLNCIRNI